MVILEMTCVDFGGDKDAAWNTSDKIKGSPSIYKEDNIFPKSINFITSHDGFTLKDLVTFNRKHNFANKNKTEMVITITILGIMVRGTNYKLIYK